jgi:hypothetical protein
MLRRSVAFTAAAAALLAGGCRSDTIRTTTGRSTTTVAGPSTTGKPGAGAPTTRKGATAASGGTATTSASGGGSAVVLSGTDLGPTTIGAPADDGVAALTRALGPPTRDLKEPGAECPGPERLVRWGRFSIQVVDHKITGWSYESTPAGPPTLATPSGVTTGTTVATLRRVYGDKLTISPADDTFPASFRIPVAASALTGTLTGTADDATTTSLTYGSGCGE